MYDRDSRARFMTPYFFGRTDSSLFGCYHPPKGAHSTDSGVLICYPIGYEYIRSHRLLLQLTKMLCRQGLHVFRFDYFGTGDSAGDLIEARTSRWIEDIQTAFSEFSDLADINHITVLGLRLGGNLALRTSLNNESLKALILCDPIFDLTDYLSRMSVMHERMKVDSYRFNISRQNTAENQQEMLGFEFTTELCDDIKHLSIEESPMVECYYVFSRESQVNIESNANIKAYSIDLDCNWNNLEYIESGLVAPELIKQIKLIVTR